MFDDSTELHYLHMYIPTFVNIRFGPLVGIAAFIRLLYTKRLGIFLFRIVFIILAKADGKNLRVHYYNDIIAL